jgi:hypothetical protein
MEDRSSISPACLGVNGDIGTSRQLLGGNLKNISPVINQIKFPPLILAEGANSFLATE